MNRRKLVAATSLLAMVGCSSYKPPITTAPVAKARVIGKDAEACWKGVIRYFSDNNIPIENLDHSSFFIKTRPILLQQAVGGTSFNGDAVALQNPWCDCGEASLANVWSTRAVIRVSFNIVLDRKPSGGTEVRINTFFDGTYMGKRQTNVPGYDVEMPLQCVSKGTMETLPEHHRDPFDRLLVAQALTEPMHLLTADAQLKVYTDLVIHL